MRLNTSTPVRFRIAVEQGSLAGLHWANPAKPPLLFCHATGFCASTYKQMLGQLSDQFDVYAIDLRGHGKTDLPTAPKKLKSWHIYANDIAAFLDNINTVGWTIAGHSMGAVTAVMASEGRSDVSSLRLIEPVAVPSIMNLAARTPIWALLKDHMSMVQKAAKRRSHWENREAVLSSYERKSLFRGWAPGVLSDYLEDGLEESPTGVALACSPAWEAATFGAQANRFWPAVAAFADNISVFAASHTTSTVSPLARTRLSRLVANVEIGQGVSHLAPMEQPDEMAAFLRK
ncbi:alpha/beta fold hydrolase [Hyphococcus lacteus]|uniref:Alpha/beta hydrolase n=1 Tax=Hyphococcus lacteus TaxID=3143536 RepID=A0ABV3Z2W5_9PROT